MTPAYNLTTRKIHKRFHGDDFQIGDVYLFQSGRAQTCTRCYQAIVVMDTQIIQRRVSEPGSGYDPVKFNDRYHLDCCPRWLVVPVAKLLEL